MRTVAAYALECQSGNDVQRFDEVSNAIRDWLVDKGWADEASDFRSTQGNRTRVFQTEQRNAVGRLNRFAVLEQLPEAIFSTEISIAGSDGKCAVFVELKVAGVGSVVQPFRFEARRPKFIGKLLHGDLVWQLGETPLTNQAYSFTGADGGRKAVQMLWHTERSVPAVVVSLVHGEAITSNFVSKLAGDLAGLAIVATLDEEASWAVTKARGIDWSCFSGAVRLYWPMGHEALNPRTHPLWLRSTMLGSAPDAGSASYRMRAQLRRQILSVSALTIREPKLIRSLKNAIRQERQEELKGLLANAGPDEYRELAESYAEDNDKLRDELKEREDENSSLRDQISELELALRYIPRDEAVVPPDVEVEPSSVIEALALARKRYSDRLIFSDSVEGGVADLHPEAGPPGKILRYLGILYDLGATREAGALGLGVVQWLEGHGVVCSVESETVRNIGGRKWAFGGQKVVFDWHLKPSDNVSPDRCVRIYFDLGDRGRVRIGWIGRHPD